VDRLVQAGGQRRLEDVHPEGPVQALDQAEGGGSREQGQRVGQLGAGLAAPGGLPGHHSAVGGSRAVQPAHRLEVGSQAGRVADQLLDQLTGVPRPVQVRQQGVSHGA
jgi:hypothetical protein